MKSISLKSMHIENFKGIKALDAAFGRTTTISGRNGSGKSSVYDAYLWALFNKDWRGNEPQVQPLTKDNEPIHDVVTSVTLVLDVDGVEMTVERKQKEDWAQPRGTTERVLKGNTQERLINATPYGVREFDEKLSTICPVKDWIILSSIDAFMGMKMEERRAKLQSLTNIISDEQLAVDFPHVLKALTEGKSLEELKRQNKLTKDAAKGNLILIPARIDQQEKLREEVNEDELKADDAKTRAYKADLEKQLADHIANRPESASDELAKQLAESNRRLSEMRQSAMAEVEKSSTIRYQMLFAKQQALQTARLEKSSMSAKKATLTKELADKRQSLTQTAESWREANSVVYTDNIQTVCPTCGHKLSAEKVAEARTNAITAFCNEKKERLSRYEATGKELTEAIDTLNAEIAELESALAKYDEQIGALEAEIENVKTTYTSKSLEDILAGMPEYADEQGNHDRIQQAINEAASGAQSAQDEYKRIAQELQVRIQQAEFTIRTISGNLGAVARNRRIDEEKARLEQEMQDYQQSLADCEQIEDEIAAFRKRKITIVEEAVSSLFTMVKWKMFEANKTNDGEKELCQAIIDGIPYEQTNTANRVNGGIDIINGLSIAMGVNVPLFVDNSESVTDIQPTPSQLITLVVTANQELTIQPTKR